MGRVSSIVALGPRNGMYVLLSLALPAIDGYSVYWDNSIKPTSELCILGNTSKDSLFQQLLLVVD